MSLREKYPVGWRGEKASRRFREPEEEIEEMRETAPTADGEQCSETIRDPQGRVIARLA